MLIGIAGPAGVGKDTVGARLATYGYSQRAFAAPIKAALAAMGFPEPASRDEKEAVIADVGVSWRHLAQTLGTEWGRDQVHPDLWLLLVKREAAKSPNLIVTDVRFGNEADWIRSSGGVIVHVFGRMTTIQGKQAKHPSENPVAFAVGDYKLPNLYGLPELHTEVDTLAQWLVNRKG